MAYDLARVRADFPALTEGAAFFDSPGGTQTPRQVTEAISTVMQRPLSNRGSRTRSEQNADDIVVGARAAIADLLRADPGGIVFGRSATQLTFDMARTLSQSWQPGDEVIVTRLDHDSNIRPWLIAADRAGATVRWTDFDPATGELDVAQIESQLSERTRLVAVTGASNLIGTKPDVAAIGRLVRSSDALFYVDGVHFTAHASVDLAELGCDFFVCSPYKFFGPHHGVLAAAPELLDSLRPDKLLPSSNAVPERFELGTLPYEMLAGTTAAVDYIASLAGSPAGSRRERLIEAHELIESHELELRDRLEEGLLAAGATVWSRAKHRTSTALFELPGQESAAVSDRLAEHGVNAPAGNFYAIEASRHLGLGDTGAVRAGITAYNNADDVERLLRALPV
ncbi:MAG: cysteine desulfurase [Propionibacteriaceae bacterium]|jgi:cysteine desulfurase family protein (TIGR01976 family)|nr:cysteine desulfurase [Propionibacteriaceae bacterium]